MYLKYFKRPFDIVCASTAIILLGWLYLILALLVRNRLGVPILFKQVRPGKNSKIFTIYKFRTMTSEKDMNGHFLSEEKRLTTFGQKLRSSSLDELPEFFNILKGDMSIVGPRPLLVEYLPLYSRRQSRRHEVKPGLTGWAQVNGRNAITWEEKLDLDVWYVEHVTFRRDLSIILKTLIIVFSKKGINASTTLSMPIFTGTVDKEEGSYE